MLQSTTSTTTENGVHTLNALAKDETSASYCNNSNTEDKTDDNEHDTPTTSASASRYQATNEHTTFTIPSLTAAGMEVVLGRTRVADTVQGSMGTVAYVGTVKTAPDPSHMYVGVVWDDPTRGKHNGTLYDPHTHMGTTYFTCDETYTSYFYHDSTSSHDNGGESFTSQQASTAAAAAYCASFLKLEKIDWGHLLTPELLRRKYVPLDSDECIAPHQQLPHIVPGCAKKTVELHGEVQIRHHQQVEELDVLCLRRMRIRDIALTTTSTTSNGGDTADSGDIQQSPVDWSCVQQCRHLDLASNLLCNWDAVTRILRVFSEAQYLSLAHNRLGDWPVGWNSLTAPLSTPTMPNTPGHLLRQLNLSRTHLFSLQQTLIPLGRALPQLQALSIAHNHWKDVSNTSPEDLAAAFANLTLLDITASHWTSSTMVLWSQLSNLHTLLLDDNPLDNLDFIQAGQWPHLQHLQLVHTRLTHEVQLEPLRHLAILRSLHLRHCSWTTALGTALARTSLIARFPQVIVLNATVVSERERHEAPRRWLQQHAPLVLTKSAATATPSIPAPDTDPLWYRLWPVYEKEMQASSLSLPAHTAGVAWTLADAIVNITLQSIAPSSCTRPPLHRRLPSTLPVRSVQALCARHFSVDVSHQVLMGQSPDQDVPIVLDDPERTLSYYGLTDGSVISMNELEAPVATSMEPSLETTSKGGVVTMASLSVSK
jgi:tubulin-specific chaperone E